MQRARTRAPDEDVARSAQARIKAELQEKIAAGKAHAANAQSELLRRTTRGPSDGAAGAREMGYVPMQQVRMCPVRA